MGERSRMRSTTTTTCGRSGGQATYRRAICTSRNGDAGQVDAAVDANQDIGINISAAVQGGVDGCGSGRPRTSCRAYLTATQTALGGDSGNHFSFDEAQASKMSIGDGRDINPDSPTFQLSRPKVPPAIHSATRNRPPGMIKVDGAGGPGGTAMLAGA
jgi:hypothetical protein